MKLKFIVVLICLPELVLCSGPNLCSINSSMYQKGLLLHLANIQIEGNLYYIETQIGLKDARNCSILLKKDNVVTTLYLEDYKSYNNTSYNVWQFNKELNNDDRASLSIIINPNVSENVELDDFQGSYTIVFGENETRNMFVIFPKSVQKTQSLIPYVSDNLIDIGTSSKSFKTCIEYNQLYSQESDYISCSAGCTVIYLDSETFKVNISVDHNNEDYSKNETFQLTCQAKDSENSDPNDATFDFVTETKGNLCMLNQKDGSYSGSLYSLLAVANRDAEDSNNIIIETLIYINETENSQCSIKLQKEGGPAKTIQQNNSDHSKANLNEWQFYKDGKHRFRLKLVQASNDTEEFEGVYNLTFGNRMSMQWFVIQGKKVEIPRPFTEPVFELEVASPGFKTCVKYNKINFQNVTLTCEHRNSSTLQKCSADKVSSDKVQITVKAHHEEIQPFQLKCYAGHKKQHIQQPIISTLRFSVSLPEDKIKLAMPGRIPIIVIVASLCGICIIIGIFFCKKKLKKSSSLIRIDSSIFNTCQNVVYLLPEKTSYPDWVKTQMIFPRETIRTEQLLGKGNYGIVYKGIYNTGNARFDVAVKTTTNDPFYKFQAQECLLDEAKTMFQIVDYHDNIVNLQAVTADFDERGEISQFYLILEYCSKGSLKDFLKEHSLDFYPPPQTPTTASTTTSQRSQYNFDINMTFGPTFEVDQLVSWSHQIANGLEFLTMKKINHGDLALRNILLNDQFVAKVSDFGLSLRMYQEESKQVKLEVGLPIRLMSPETLKSRMTTDKSDVWSFGVLLWEIFDLGINNPYGEKEINYAGMIAILESGTRLHQPKLCPSNIYSIMQTCWNSNPDLRPTFTEIKMRLEEIKNHDNEMERLALNATQSRFQAIQHSNPGYLTMSPSVSPMPESDENSVSYVKLSHAYSNPNILQ